MDKLFLYTLHLADTTVVLAQRNSEWTGHGPVLEQDIAITNIALDLLGQSRNLYQLAAHIYNEASHSEKEAVDKYLPRPWKAFSRQLEEDDLAFLREERQFLSLLITELPKGDWAFTVLRQFFFSAFQSLQWASLLENNEEALQPIAEKSLKEVKYHLRWSSEWVIRLADGTEESKQRIINALPELWPFTGEMFQPAFFETQDLSAMKASWLTIVKDVFDQAGLEIPQEGWAQQGGKDGKHTEHLGYLLAEMQYLPRTYPNLTW